MAEIRMRTARAPVNIAVIKYWGKRDEDLILPVSDSISVTLSKKEMCATTTVACSASFKRNRIWLNGKEQDVDIPRIRNCLTEIKQRAMESGDQSLIHWPIHICSENNFPTAAGLASSAAGYACLVYALAHLYGVEGDISGIARQGSGSACRSIYGGFVQWEKGIKNDGSDSIARQIASEIHWPELRAVILVVNSAEKAVSSTLGMKRTMNTSDLIKYRISKVLPKRIEQITKAILNKDFALFAEITMKDSNQFHAVCLDSYPAIHYMNSTSFAIIDLIHAYNEFYGKNKVAYTFDAGPNACLYMLHDSVDEVLNLIKMYFPFTIPKESDIRGFPATECELSNELIAAVKLKPLPNSLQFIINTKVGSGPEIVTDKSKHLLNLKGMPILE